MSAQDTRAWHEITRDTLKANSIKLVTYVPDNVLKPLIKAVHEDDYFTAFATTREERPSASCRARGWLACAASC